MSYFQVKTLLAVFFIAAGLTAALSMLALMGKTENKMSAAALRRTHRVAGYLFAALLVVLAAMGMRHLAAVGDALSLRGVMHWVLASLLVLLFLLKLAVVRIFRQFLKLAPVMGMMIIVLALLVATLSAAFALMSWEHLSPPSRAEVALRTTDSRESGTQEIGGGYGGTGQGEAVFQANCAGCHRADSEEAMIGPGLARLFARDTLRSGDRPVTRDSVRRQVLAPRGGMPAFDGVLSGAELDSLLTYLQTL